MEIMQEFNKLLIFIGLLYLQIFGVLADIHQTPNGISDFPKVQRIFFQISEEGPAGKFIGDLYTELKQNGAFTNIGNLYPRENYSFKSVNPPGSQLFTLYSNGTLINNIRLDREKICPNKQICNQTFSAILNLPNKHDTFLVIELNIVIKDIPDCFPSWTSLQTTLSIIESETIGSEKFISRVIDPDSPFLDGNYDFPKSPEINFEIKDNSKSFGIIAKNNSFSNNEFSNTEKLLYLVILKQLDRENLDAYYFNVCIRVPKKENVLNQDFNGWREDFRTSQFVNCIAINISILDANDETPNFLENLFNTSIRIPENTPLNSVILVLKAKDNDLDRNAELMFNYTYPTGDEERNLFGIETRLGEIFIKNQLDFEKAQRHILYLSVQDRGENPKSSSVQVTINVCIFQKLKVRRFLSF